MSQNLERSLAFFEARNNCEAQDVLDEFRKGTGAGLHFRNGTYELTYCGIKGTATSGSASQLISSWTRAAGNSLDTKTKAAR